MGRPTTGRAIPDHQPLVSTLPRAAWLLGLAPEALEAAVDRAGLEEWGRHADGSSVFAWGPLLEAVQAAGFPIPAGRGHRWRVRPTIIQKAAK
jgi:hypothetical protein